MNKPYKICFLGYKKLGELARGVIATLDYDDTEVVEKECEPSTLVEVVNEARTEGCQVFIAGASNAAEFRNAVSDHLVEINIDLADYLLSLKKAADLGAERIAIAVYRYSRRVDMELLRKLTHSPLELVYYEDEDELTAALRSTDCDVVVGASLANEIAERLNRKSVLIYEGEYTIRTSIEKARGLAADLRAEARHHEVTNAIIRNSPAGIIVADEHGRITVFNAAARELAGIRMEKLQGKPLSDVLPSLSYEAFRKTDQPRVDRKHLINGVMIRCVQTRLGMGQEQIGMLITLLADNTRRKKAESGEARGFVARHQWKDLVGGSSTVRETLAEAKSLAALETPMMISGELGTGKSFFAQCIHNASSRAGEPYLTINAGTLAAQNTANVLFGEEDASGTRIGLLELAGGGTVVLQNLANATEAFNACLMQVLTEQYFFRIGGVTPVPFSARCIAIVTKEDRERIPKDLWLRLSAFSLDIPPLRERREDIVPLFQFFLLQENALARQRLQKELTDLLLFYSWPGNLVSLSAVCKRYALYLKQAVNPSASARQLLLIKAIGAEELLRDIYAEYPALLDAANSPPEEVVKGVAVMKRLLKYNNSIIAEKLNLGRTTLWRMQKNAGLEE